MRKIIFLFLIAVTFSCGSTKGENGKPGESGKNGKNNLKGADGKNGANGKDKSIVLKL